MLKPSQNIVLIKTAAVSDKKGSIYIPEQSLPRAREGVVVAVGPGKMTKRGRIPMTVQMGDTVLFEYGRGVVLHFGGEEYRAIREPDISCILDEPMGNDFDPREDFLMLHEVKS